MGKRKRQVSKGRGSGGRTQSARRAGGSGLRLVEVDLPPELLAVIDVEAVMEMFRSSCPICAEGREHAF